MYVYIYIRMTIRACMQTCIRSFLWFSFIFFAVTAVLAVEATRWHPYGRQQLQMTVGTSPNQKLDAVLWQASPEVRHDPGF